MQLIDALETQHVTLYPCRRPLTLSLFTGAHATLMAVLLLRSTPTSRGDSRGSIRSREGRIKSNCYYYRHFLNINLYLV